MYFEWSSSNKNSRWLWISTFFRLKNMSFPNLGFWVFEISQHCSDRPQTRKLLFIAARLRKETLWHWKTFWSFLNFDLKSQIMILLNSWIYKNSKSLPLFGCSKDDWLLLLGECDWKPSCLRWSGKMPSFSVLRKSKFKWFRPIIRCCGTNGWFLMLKFC